MAYRRNQDQLAMIGAEGFALLDSGKRGVQQPLPRREPIATATKRSFWSSQKAVHHIETVVDCNKAAQVYGGILVKEYVNTAPVRKDVHVTRSLKEHYVVVDFETEKQDFHFTRDLYGNGRAFHSEIQF